MIVQWSLVHSFILLQLSVFPDLCCSQKLHLCLKKVGPFGTSIPDYRHGTHNRPIVTVGFVCRAGAELGEMHLRKCFPRQKQPIRHKKQQTPQRQFFETASVVHTLHGHALVAFKWQTHLFYWQVISSCIRESFKSISHNDWQIERRGFGVFTTPLSPVVVPRALGGWQAVLAIAADIYRSAQGSRLESALHSAFQVLWALASECPKECFLSVFGVFCPKKGPKTLKEHSLGHSEPGAQKHSSSTPWGTFRPGPLGTPVNRFGPISWRPPPSPTPRFIWHRSRGSYAIFSVKVPFFYRRAKGLICHATLHPRHPSGAFFPMYGVEVLECFHQWHAFVATSGQSGLDKCCRSWQFHCTRKKGVPDKPQTQKYYLPKINCLKIILKQLSEPFAIGPVQFSWPRGAAGNWFTKPGFWEHFVSFLEKKAKHRVHQIFFSHDPGNLLNLIFRDWPWFGGFRNYKFCQNLPVIPWKCPSSRHLLGEA